MKEHSNEKTKQTKELSKEKTTRRINFWTTNQTKEALWPSFQEPHQAKPQPLRLQSVQNACNQAYNAAAMKLFIIFSKKQHVDKNFAGWFLLAIYNNTNTNNTNTNNQKAR